MPRGRSNNTLGDDSVRSNMSVFSNASNPMGGGHPRSRIFPFKDESAGKLSYVGDAAYKALRKKHRGYHHKLWNVTSGRVVESVQHTPKDAFPRLEDPEIGQDHWFVDKMYNLLCKTEEFCDVMSLAPPDGLFVSKFKEALEHLQEKTVLLNRRKIKIRMLFGHIIGMPVDCVQVMKELTENIPRDRSNIQLWVGAWRKGVSWNHAKIIAVDGRYLHTGGHNLWDYHYLKSDPVHDVSVMLEGRIANDAHLFANQQWAYIEKNKYGTFCAGCNAPCTALAIGSLVSVCEFPPGKAAMFPPFLGLKKTRALKHKLLLMQNPNRLPDLVKDTMQNGKQKLHDRKTIIQEKLKQKREQIEAKRKEMLNKIVGKSHPNKGSQSMESIEYNASFNNIKDDFDVDNAQYVPIISIGRPGNMLGNKDRPSDDAIVAMLSSAKTVVRLALQDLGPVTIPGTKIALPGMVWPKDYLSALGRAIWQNDAHVEIILSNPGSTPGNLSPLEAQYGNGWSCIDVAAEIIKTIQQQFPKAGDSALSCSIRRNLRVCFIRTKQGRHYDGGMSIGLHSKHFIVDDRCCYIGSQNLYICDLAEWGVIIDDPTSVEKIKCECWDQMWETSFTGEDVDVRAVMDGLKINRDGENIQSISSTTREKMAEAMAIANHANYRKSVVMKSLSRRDFGSDEFEDPEEHSEESNDKQKKCTATALPGTPTTTTPSSTAASSTVSHLNTPPLSTPHSNVHHHRNIDNGYEDNKNDDHNESTLSRTNLHHHLVHTPAYSITQDDHNYIAKYMNNNNNAIFRSRGINTGTNSSVQACLDEHNQFVMESKQQYAPSSLLQPDAKAYHNDAQRRIIHTSIVTTKTVTSQNHHPATVICRTTSEEGSTVISRIKPEKGEVITSTAQ